jgi:hypothetical protein
MGGSPAPVTPILTVRSGARELRGRALRADCVRRIFDVDDEWGVITERMVAGDIRAVAQAAATFAQPGVETTAELIARITGESTHAAGIGQAVVQKD